MKENLNVIHSRRWWAPYSLKTRISVILLICTLIPLASIGTISYYSISSILHHNIKKGIQNNLEQAAAGFDRTLHNLDYASRQLALDGRIGDEVQAFLSADSTDSKKYEINQEIIKNMTLVNYTNPDLGIMMYYFPDSNRYLFSNVPVKEDKDVLDNSMIATRQGAVFYGPHQTMFRNGDKLVLSVTRKTGYTMTADVPYVYMETNFDLFQKLMMKEQYGVNANYILLNDKGIVMYSELPKLYPVGKQWDVPIHETGMVQRDGNDYFQQTSEYGNALIVAVSERDFNKQVRNWLNRFILLGLSSLIISLLLAGLIWRTIYRSLRNLNKEIRLVSNNQFSTAVTETHIKEFDNLLTQFYFMREKILELIQEVEQKEKMKRRLEVEKILYQINPHFLHNTLNSIQCIARMNGQKEIDRLVSVFTRVLHYNLGKEGGLVTIGQEIQALQDYVDLQRIRYDYNFDVRMEVDASVLTVPIPRFLLQPLVENALYHGLKETDGLIRVIVKREGDNHIMLEVSDNGAGMSPETVARILHEPTDRSKVGLGIGLNFVNNMVKVHYGDQVQLQIDSEPGAGTRMRWRLPILQGGVQRND